MAAAASSSPLIARVRWLVGLLFFSSSMLEAPPKGSPNPLANEIFRTSYHFQPSHNWMNDPNAPMYYNGFYHFFYQKNPNDAVWIFNISWGHSVSTDLIHWVGLEIALSPSDPLADISGCWSGSATILSDNRPVIVYTGLDKENRQVQNVAYPKNVSDPFLREWVKPDYNPIIEPFEGVDVTLFRDPSTAWLGRDGVWRLVVGTVLGRDGQAALYKSKDFVKWVRAEHPLHFTNGSGMWECVDFFPLEVPSTGEKKYLLKVSLWEYLTDHYTLGTYDEERDVFVGDDASSNDYRMWPRLDYGHIYASKTFFDEAKHRRILWGWSNESDSVADDQAKGWAGIQTVPRVFSLDYEGKQLVQWPVEEVESLRSDEIHWQDIELRTGGLVEVKGLQASQADVEVEFELPSLIAAEPFDTNWIVDPSKLCREKGAHSNGGIGPFGLLVLASDNLEENTAIYFRVFRADTNYKVLMCTDSRRSSLWSQLYMPASGGFVDVDVKKDGKISLRTLIDHSVVESFGGKGRTCITSRVYPTMMLNGNTHLYAFNYGTEAVRIFDLKAWNMTHAQIKLKKIKKRKNQ